MIKGLDTEKLREFIACVEQMHFSAFVSPTKKIVSARSSCKTISMMSFLFFFTPPMKLSDRKMQLITRAKSQGLTTALKAS